MTAALECLDTFSRKMLQTKHAGKTRYQTSSQEYMDKWNRQEGVAKAANPTNNWKISSTL